MNQPKEHINPRLEAKLKELQQRGLLETAKAYVAPQDKNVANDKK